MAAKVLLDRRLELAHPHEHDLLFFVGHRVDRHRQPRASRAHLHPVAQVGSPSRGVSRNRQVAEGKSASPTAQANSRGGSQATM